MDQVLTEHIKDNQFHDWIIGPIIKTLTTPQSMKKLALEHGFRCDSYKNQFHLVKFVDVLDENDELDAEMIEHDFYF
jgi:hypothetical protein